MTTTSEATVERLPANAPCWCGSGRKYKRCHRAADLDPALAAAGDAPPFPPTGRRVRPGVQSPVRTVPDSIPKPPYARGEGMPARRDAGEPKDAETIQRMRRAGRAAAEVLAAAGAAIVPGMTTDEIDRIVHEETIKRGGYPSPLLYGHPPYPKSCCTSINEVICHGIPDSTELVSGDIVNVDVTVYLDGVHGDTNATFFVGGEAACDLQSRALVRVTRECLEKGIEAVKPGARVRDIGRAIQPHAEAAGFSVVRSFVGHGLGEQFHADPTITHYDDPRATRLLEPGMTFTIEPMINVGSWRHKMWPDEWTAITVDGKRSAQFEHSLVVTDTGAEVLTAL
ncbi:MAG TPA: type I methionyl aminopeptidase [Mycobacteriales bacterium]|nr:type I methionyl aminopeptidase [Mycobacteriales bacterium]